ncbi:MAG: glycosyltransferase family 1 protein [Candidatus Peribacteraceae bacterium]|nr:glycosyltransferase family 1 protein [Candidatus Peribacteraceae bacterium]
MIIKKIERKRVSDNVLSAPPIGDKKLKVAIVGHNVYNSSSIWMAVGFKRHPKVEEVFNYDYKDAVKTKNAAEIKSEFLKLDENYDLIIIMKGTKLPLDVVPKNPKSIFFYWFMDRYLTEGNKKVASTCHFRSATGFGIASEITDLLSMTTYHIIDGAAPEHFYKMTPRPTKDIDVSFVGDSGETDRKSIHNELKKMSGVNAQFFGPGFSSFVYPDKYREICNRSKIVLNLSRSDNRGRKIFIGYSSLRLWNVLSCGSMVITKPIPEMTKYLGLKEGRDIVTYNDINSLKLKINHYLQNEKEREKIASNGWRYASENRTWNNVANDIIDVITTEPSQRIQKIKLDNPKRKEIIQRRMARPIRRNV